jgi:hypothetical protein
VPARGTRQANFDIEGEARNQANLNKANPAKAKLGDKRYGR